MSISFPSLQSMANESLAVATSSSISQIDLAETDYNQDRQVAISSNLQDNQEKTQTVVKRALSPSKSPSSCQQINQLSCDESQTKLQKSSNQEDVSSSKKTKEQHSVALVPSACALRSQENCVLQLSVNLLKTYKSINARYYSKKSAQELAVLNPCIAPSTLSSRVLKVSRGSVQIGRILGEGSYGKVYEGIYWLDGAKETIKVAFKVNKTVHSRSESLLYMQSIVSEVEFYKSVKIVDKSGCSPIAELIDDGAIGSNCHGLVQKLYSKNLYDCLKRTNQKGFSFILTAKIAVQLFQALSLLRHPSINKIHADLKPENLVFYDGKTYKIRIIDFGSACSPSINPDPGAYICSRFYRPPEIIFRLPFDHSFDTWSVGCLLFELHTGKPLFPANNQMQLLSMIYEFLGPPSEEFVKAIPDWQRIFAPSADDPNSYVLMASDPKLRTHVKETRPQFFDRMLSLQSAETRAYPLDSKIYHNEQTYLLFKNLIKSMIVWDAKDRLSPAQLLAHPFFSEITMLSAALTAEKKPALSSGVVLAGSLEETKPLAATQESKEDKTALHNSVQTVDTEGDN